MVMVVNGGRWCLGFLGDAGFPDHLKLWLRIHGDEDLRVHMLTRWLISHHVRGVAWRSPQGSWLNWRAALFVRQFNRQMRRVWMQCAIREVVLETHLVSKETDLPNTFPAKARVAVN